MKERERTVILKCFTSFAGVTSGGQHQTQYRSADLSAGSGKKIAPRSWFVDSVILVEQPVDSTTIFMICIWGQIFSAYPSRNFSSGREWPPSLATGESPSHAAVSDKLHKRAQGRRLSQPLYMFRISVKASTWAQQFNILECAEQFHAKKEAEMSPFNSNGVEQ